MPVSVGIACEVVVAIIGFCAHRAVGQNVLHLIPALIIVRTGQLAVRIRGSCEVSFVVIIVSRRVSARVNLLH